jgi:23S rRNA (adenine2503-C2)-methyltransferase
MGMGEPLHNYDATVRAVRILADNDGLGLSTRRITISTVGLIPELERLGKDFRGRIALAVSLHAPNDELRSRLVPANRRYPLVPLMAALRRYPLPPRRRITIEYALIQGVNDEEKMAVELIELLRGIPVKVNLIPLNPVAHSELHPSTVERLMRFQRVLIEGGLSCFVRKRRGDDISAACGQLAGKRRELASQT